MEICDPSYGFGVIKVHIHIRILEPVIVETFVPFYLVAYAVPSRAELTIPLCKTSTRTNSTMSYHTHPFHSWPSPQHHHIVHLLSCFFSSSQFLSIPDYRPGWFCIICACCSANLWPILSLPA